MSAGRKALIVATYEYADAGLRRLAAPEHDAEALATVLEDPQIADFDVTTLVNQPHHVVGEAIADFYADARRDDLTLIYFTGHGLKDDEGRFHLAMTNTRRSALMFTAISGAQLNDAMDASPSRRKVLVLDCCYSGAFPAGRTAKADEGVQTLERFQGKGRAVLTASDATQYAFEGDDLRGSGTSSVFTRHLVEAIRSGAADLDEDGDIALDELYSYVYDRVVAEMPQQRPKKQEDVDGRILIARNVNWKLPAHLQHAIESPIAAQRLGAVEGLAHLHRAGNDVVRAAVAERLAALADDDSRSVSSAASAAVQRLGAAALPAQPAAAPAPAVESSPSPSPTVESPVAPAAPRPAAAVPRLPPVQVPVPVPVSVAEPPVSAVEPPSDATVVPPAAGRAAGRDAVSLVLALVVLSAVPLTLSRLLSFEASYPATADEWSESTIPWTLMIVLPLAVAAALLAARDRLPRALPVAFGLVLGVALVLVEHAVFWIFYFIESASYLAGPALWLLVVGAAVVATAGLVILTRSPVSGRPPVRTGWRVLCALGVLACLVWFVVAGPETDGTWWVALYEGSFILGAAALPITLLWLRADQRIAALVAIALFATWSLYFIVRELRALELGFEPAVWQVELVSVVLTLLACVVAQTGPPREPAAVSTEPR